MRIASQFVAFLIVAASLVAPCFAASKAAIPQKLPIESGAASMFVSSKIETGNDLSKFFTASSPCKNNCHKKQCSKTVINRTVTQVRFVLLPIPDGPLASISQLPRLRDQKLSRLFAKNVRNCNRSVNLYELCRQLN